MKKNFMSYSYVIGVSYDVLKNLIVTNSSVIINLFCHLLISVFTYNSILQKLLYPGNLEFLISEPQ